jgi:hypothetical protein
MEPLINVYVEDDAVFLAMRLLPEQGAEDVQPVKVTYASQRPMIPLKLTAVAANPDMAVMTWFYAEHQAVPVNYAKIDFDPTELTFNSFGGGNNYRQLMGDKADEFNGRGFITEYAMPTSELSVSHPLLQELGSQYPYITRLNTVISPEEMTVDPVFDYDSELDDVSNIHNLSDMTGMFDCERDPEAFGVSNVSPANPASVDPPQGGGNIPPRPSNNATSQPEAQPAVPNAPTNTTGNPVPQSPGEGNAVQGGGLSPIATGGMVLVIFLVVLAFGAMIVRGSR